MYPRHFSRPLQPATHDEDRTLQVWKSIQWWIIVGPRKMRYLPVLFEVRQRCRYTNGGTSNLPISNVGSIYMGWLSCSQEVNFPTSPHITAVPRTKRSDGTSSCFKSICSSFFLAYTSRSSTGSWLLLSWTLMYDTCLNEPGRDPGVHLFYWIECGSCCWVERFVFITLAVLMRGYCKLDLFFPGRNVIL